MPPSTPVPETSTPAAATGAAPARVCASCGGPVTGRVCPTCGQRVLPRITLRAIAAGALSWLLDADGSFVTTVRGLVTRPERVIGDVQRGRTLPYAGPFAFVGIGLALAGLVITYTPGSNLGQSHDSWIPGVLLPVFLAAAGRLVFLRGRLNFAEHLVANLYLVGTDGLLLVPVWLLSYASRRSVGGPVLLGGLLAIAAMHLRGLARLHGGGWRAWLGALTTAALALAGGAVFLVYYIRVVKAIFHT